RRADAPRACAARRGGRSDSRTRAPSPRPARSVGIATLIGVLPQARHGVEALRVVRRRNERMAATGIFYVFAYVSDLARSKKFYGETLGWSLGTDEAHVAGFSVGSGYLVLHDDDRPRDARSYGGGMHVAIRWDDVDAERARLATLGVRVSELHD